MKIHGLEDRVYYFVTYLWQYFVYLCFVTTFMIFGNWIQLAIIAKTQFRLQVRCLKPRSQNIALGDILRDLGARNDRLELLVCFFVYEKHNSDVFCFDLDRPFGFEWMFFTWIFHRPWTSLDRNASRSHSIFESLSRPLGILSIRFTCLIQQRRRTHFPKALRRKQWLRSCHCLFWSSVDRLSDRCFDLQQSNTISILSKENFPEDVEA